MNLETLSLVDLRIFLSVARSGSLRSAARQMYISQPTLSRAIARLEMQMGVPLLSRSPQGVHLTESGEALIIAGRRVLDAVSSLGRDVAFPSIGTIKIGATATSARSILAPYISDWIPAHPSVHLTAIEDSDMRLRRRLEDGDCDAAIISGEPSARLESLKVATVQVMAMIPSGHQLAQSNEPLSLRELSREPLLINGDGYPSSYLVLRAMELARLTPTIAYQCSAGQTLAALAEAGLGVAVFGDTTNLSGFALHRRQIVDASGELLSFDLYIAWKRGELASLLKEFCVGLATFRNPNGSAEGVSPRGGLIDANPG